MIPSTTVRISEMATYISAGESNLALPSQDSTQEGSKGREEANEKACTRTEGGR